MRLKSRKTLIRLIHHTRSSPETLCWPCVTDTTSVHFQLLQQEVLITPQMTIAQIVYDNELSFGYTDEEIHDKVRRMFTGILM